MSSAVIIVDDEPGMRELVKCWLTGEEYVAHDARGNHGSDPVK
jgi:DNA-binding NtrC family response regulator